MEAAKAPDLQVIDCIDLDERRAVRSFDNFLRVGVSDPKKLMNLIDQLTQPSGAGDAYPARFAAMYLIGMVRGALALNPPDNVRQQFLEGMRRMHADILQLKPEDFIGPKRKFARGGGI